MVEYNYAASLGNFCFSAEVLRIVQARYRSLPFDWLFTTPRFTTRVLKDDFKQFLNPDNFIDIFDRVESIKRQAGHLLYHENFFNHKDPRNKIDYDYYVRCINRFRDLLKLSDKKLFVCSYKNLKTEMDDVLMSDIFRLNETLAEITDNYHIVCNINYPNNSEITHKITEKGNVTFFELYTKDENDGLNFSNGEDRSYFFKIFKSLFEYKNPN